MQMLIAHSEQSCTDMEAALLSVRTLYIAVMRSFVLIYTVSQKKTSKIIFVITTSNFHQI